MSTQYTYLIYWRPERGGDKFEVKVAGRNERSAIARWRYYFGLRIRDQYFFRITKLKEYNNV